MNTTQKKPRFELKASKRIEVVEYAVCLDGVQVGLVECTGYHSENIRWHAHFQKSKEVGGSDLFQGHGSTPDDAIANAIIESHQRHQKALSDLDELETIMVPASDEDEGAEF